MEVVGMIGLMAGVYALAGVLIGYGVKESLEAERQAPDPVLVASCEPLGLSGLPANLEEPVSII